MAAASSSIASQIIHLKTSVSHLRAGGTHASNETADALEQVVRALRILAKEIDQKKG